MEILQGLSNQETTIVINDYSIILYSCCLVFERLQIRFTLAVKFDPFRMISDEVIAIYVDSDSHFYHIVQFNNFECDYT